MLDDEMRKKKKTQDGDNETTFYLEMNLGRYSQRYSERGRKDFSTPFHPLTFL